MDPQSPTRSTGSGASRASSRAAQHSAPGSISSGLTIPDDYSVEEYGRLFNAYREGKYLLPNDGEEQDRLDLQHHWWFLLLGGRLYDAPIGDPADVLDIGTGTGIWAIRFAREHPTARVVGTDLSLIQPHSGPPNCSFVRDDAEEEWLFGYKFDYIHWRLMLTCFSDFPTMLRKVFDNLKPGGWAEFHESVFELLPSTPSAAETLHGSALERSFQYCVEAGLQVGRDFNAAKKFKAWMIEAGFVDVVEKQYLSPVNGWPADPVDRNIGKWYSLNMLRFPASITKMLQSVGMAPEEIPAFQEQIRHDVTSLHMKVYHPLYVIYGRKPPQ